MKTAQTELIATPQFDSGRWKLRLERAPLSAIEQSNNTQPWIPQPSQRLLSQREELYKHFIEKASEAHADSLARQTANVGEITQLVDLYALVSMMRVISSAPIVEVPTTWSV